MHRTHRKIEKLILDCYKEIADHLMQSEVSSTHIQAINNNLKEILNHLDMSSSSFNEHKSRNREKAVNRGHFKNSLLKICYAMSRFDYPIINDALNSDFNQTDTFEYLAQKLNIKSSTLRNYRDRFDPYVTQENSNRKGWWQVELSGEFQAIKSEYDGKSYDEVKDDIAAIISL